MNHPLLRALAFASVLCLVGGVVYFGLIFKGQLTDHRWLQGKNDLLLHALAFGPLMALATLSFERPGPIIEGRKTKNTPGFPRITQKHAAARHFGAVPRTGIA